MAVELLTPQVRPQRIARPPRRPEFDQSWVPPPGPMPEGTDGDDDTLP